MISKKHITLILFCLFSLCTVVADPVEYETSYSPE